MEALALANSIRLSRAELKRGLRAADSASARKRVAQLIHKPPPELERMATLDLLASCRQVGRHTALRCLRAARVGERVCVGSLTPRQRRALAEALR